jgi:FixJ family two-component response regulator
MHGRRHAARQQREAPRAVVDDDASMRGALEGLFDLVGLQIQTYARGDHRWET